MPLVIIMTFILVVCANTTGEAEIIKSHSRTAMVSGEVVRIVTPELIKSRNLTLDWELQEYISSLCRKNRSGVVSVAVLNPQTGDILAMYGKGPDGENCSLALKSYLAASLFKMVTAAAAIDYAGMSASSMMFYSGNAHTLYKNQITDKKNRWTTQVSLARAFASSNNVIFGKIGAIQLGERPLLLTAARLGFWKSPAVDLQCTPSTVFIPETDFNLAELASGYNRFTRVSPVHAAQMVSAVVNNGSMIKARIVRTSDTGLEQVMCRETAEDLRTMMCQTVKNGTVAKAFYNYQNDRVLKGLSIGAKSGSINGVDPEGRRHWFMGFAEDPNTGDAITIGCLVIHDSRTQVETFDLARNIIRHHFAKPTMVASSN